MRRQEAFVRICREQVRQGCDHPQRIADLYRTIYEAARREFYEDNEVTLRAFLRERFDAALKPEPNDG